MPPAEVSTRANFRLSWYQVRNSLAQDRKLQMRLWRQVLAVTIISFAIAALVGSSRGGQVSGQSKQQEIDIDLIVKMSGRCSTLRIAGRDLACRAVRYFHGEGGRAYFTIAVDDPNDNAHVISFSGESSRREGDSLYELTIDQMMLNSSDRPKVEGLRVPLVEVSTGTCRQLGSLAANLISSVSCVATDDNGKKYELQFESDGAPVVVQRISQYHLGSERRQARLRELFECRRKAYLDKILPRDSTSYIIQCLGEGGGQKPATDDQH
jgi:hypothetical protein